jgi:hypothetical protein
MFWKPSEVLLEALEIAVWTCHCDVRRGGVRAKAEICEIIFVSDIGAWATTFGRGGCATLKMEGT